MKVSKLQMAQHRERIIAAASRRFREKGFEGVNVAELMRAAGLTHGGFYNHFHSKEELMSLASRRAFDELLSRWNKLLERNPSNPLKAVIEGYLSRTHLEHPENGCVIAALGTETPRQVASVRAAAANGIESMLGILESSLPGRTKKQRRQQAAVTLSQMVGAMVLARAANDNALATKVLTASSAFLKLTMRKQS